MSATIKPRRPNNQTTALVPRWARGDEERDQASTLGVPAHGSFLQDVAS